jgi:chromosome segregation ATPase
VEVQQVEFGDEYPTEPKFPGEIESLLESYGIDPQGLDPKQIVKLLEERRVELVRNNQIVKEEKDRLLSQLDKAKTKIQYSDAECTKLVEKINWFESKVLNGGKNLLDYTNEQQKLIQLKQKELKEQKVRQDDIRRKIEEHELSATEINEVISKMETEIEYKETKTSKLCSKIEKVREQAVKTQEAHAHQRSEMETCQSELQK